MAECHFEFFMLHIGKKPKPVWRLFAEYGLTVAAAIFAGYLILLAKL